MKLHVKMKVPAEANTSAELAGLLKNSRKHVKLISFAKESEFIIIIVEIDIDD